MQFIMTKAGITHTGVTTKSEQELGKHSIRDSHLVTLATLAVHTGNTLGHPWGTLE